MTLGGFARRGSLTSTPEPSGSTLEGRETSPVPILISIAGAS